MRVTDASGAALPAAQVRLVCAGDAYDHSFAAGADGTLTAPFLPYGVYQVVAREAGFAPLALTVEIGSAIPVVRTLRLGVSPVTTQVTVTPGDTLIDPHTPGAVMRIGAGQIAERVESLPGRSVQDLVNSQPGWLYEGNAVLHPRGSEYQTQLVVDGIPLTDDRSPGFGPEIEADDLESISVYTAGYPAEYGRKLGGWWS